MKVPLTDWAKLHYSKEIGINTLRRYAREGRFSPEVEMVAGCYMVDENAKLTETRSRARTEMVKKAAAMKMNAADVDLSKVDPVVLEIVGNVA
ncbi:excisionase [Neptuniibacter sp.]|uniref:excisionase n=1 Tax=Neptuniibacter sp. TaxID=1962643 RepID=UPI0026084743|nr:excisionase [Neptuniibacter sp.]MCP4597813.1 hypothetical protein [Neptuniibacter sp.]